MDKDKEIDDILASVLDKKSDEISLDELFTLTQTQIEKSAEEEKEEESDGVKRKRKKPSEKQKAKKKKTAKVKAEPSLKLKLPKKPKKAGKTEKAKKEKKPKIKKERTTSHKAGSVKPALSKLFKTIGEKSKKLSASIKAGFRKLSESKAVTEFKSVFIPKLVALLKRIFTKRVICALAIIAVLAGAAVGAVKLYDYSKVAYLKPYESKYKIEYPVGILEQFCDAYGKNQHIVGAISIDDTDTNKYVANQIMSGIAYMNYSCDITQPEQFRSIDLEKSYCDLEKIYSTPDGFLESTQEVTFNTLFERAHYKVIAAFYTNENPQDDNNYRFPYNLYGNMTEQSFEVFVDKIKSRRLYDTGCLPTYEDNVLMLSVDSDIAENFKFVVVCVKSNSRKIRKSDTAEQNKMAHYPQVWYDMLEKRNPYSFATGWYPQIYTNAEKTKKTQLKAENFE